MVVERPGVNFINILCAAFMHSDTKSIEIQSSCQYLFTLLQSALIKAAQKILIKLMSFSEGCKISRKSQNNSISLKIPICQKIYLFTGENPKTNEYHPFKE